MSLSFQESRIRSFQEESIRTTIPRAKEVIGLAKSSLSTNWSWPITSWMTTAMWVLGFIFKKWITNQFKMKRIECYFVLNWRIINVTAWSVSSYFSCYEFTLRSKNSSCCAVFFREKRSLFTPVRNLSCFSIHRWSSIRCTNINHDFILLLTQMTPWTSKLCARMCSPQPSSLPSQRTRITGWVNLFLLLKVFV